MVTIALQGAEFFARHGYYPEEQILGNRFIVDIEVSYDNDLTDQSDSLEDTVNYEQLYAIAQTTMLHTKKLLETVAQSMVDHIRQQFNYLTTIRVAIRKLNPPLKGAVNESSVTIVYTNQDNGI